MLIFQSKKQSKNDTFQINVGKAILKRVYVSTTKLYQRLDQGEYNSLFKSGGIEYAESRPYNYGDDARYIDWTVSSRMNMLYSKCFHEDTNRTIWGILDSSGSMQLGAPISLYEIGIEVLLILSQLGVYHRNKVGGMCVAESIIGHVRPSTSFRVIDEYAKMLLSAQYRKEKSNFDETLYFTKNILKKRSLIIICSDFLAPDSYSFVVKISKIHDVLLVRTKYDYKELLPTSGIINLIDAEDEKKGLISISKIRRNLGIEYTDEDEYWKQFCNKNNFVNITIKTTNSILQSLLYFLKKGKR